MDSGKKKKCWLWQSCKDWVLIVEDIIRSIRKQF